MLLTFGPRAIAFAQQSNAYCNCIQAASKTIQECKNEFLKDTPPLLTPNCGIRLMQPLDDTTRYLQPPNGKPFETLQMYFKISWPWIIGCAAGIAVLQALIGGVQIMMSGSDSGARSAGKERLMWALAGLLLIGLSGMILQILNPIYYYQ